jgi:hypothetical protein
MSENWDSDYNPGSITPAQALEIRNRELIEQGLRRRQANGNYDLPLMSRDTLRQRFARYSGLSDEMINDEYVHADRIMWICHDCGAFGYKFDIKEKFRCYGWRCHSRNVTVARTGDISLAIRRSIENGVPVGENMNDIWERRRERMREARRARTQR